MSISSLTNRNDYVGNNTTDEYDFTFRILAASDLRVTERDTDNIETTLVLNTDYTVDGVGEEAGGTITLTGGNLATDHALTIRRVRPLKQETDIRNQGPYFPETVEDAFDHTVMLAQQLQDQIDRCVKLTETDYDDETFLPVSEERAGQYLAFDANGVPIAVSATPGTVVVTSFMETVLDDTTASAARTTLGFSGAGGTVASGNIEDGAVTAAKLASNSVTTAKISDLNVTTAKINDAAVTNAKLGLLAVGSGNIVDNGVTTAKINNLAVTLAKIESRSVVQGSSITGSIGGSTGNYLDVTGVTAVYTRTGRPLLVYLVGDAANPSYLSLTSSSVGAGANVTLGVRLSDGSNTYSVHTMSFIKVSGVGVGNAGVWGAGNFNWLIANADTGSKTYQLQVLAATGDTIGWQNISLFAYEIP